MDVLKGLNIKSILKLLQKSDDEFLDLPKEMKLAHANKTRPACNRQMKVTKNRENLIWQCYGCDPNQPRNRKPFFNGTFFEGTHLSSREAGFRIVILLIKATCNKQFVTTDQDDEFYKKWPLVETESQFILEHIQHEMPDYQEKPIFKCSTNEMRRKVWKSVQTLHSYSPLLTVNRIIRRRDAEIQVEIITSQQLTSEILAV